MNPTLIAVMTLVVAILSLVLTPFGAWTAIKVGVATLQATVSAKLDEIARRLDTAERERSTDQKRIGRIENRLTKVETMARIRDHPHHDTEPPPSDEEG